MVQHFLNTHFFKLLACAALVVQDFGPSNTWSKIELVKLERQTTRAANELPPKFMMELRTVLGQIYVCFAEMLLAHVMKFVRNKLEKSPN